MKQLFNIIVVTLFPFLIHAQTGMITTVAGNGIYGDSGDSGLATNAKIGPMGQIAFDELGNYYFCHNTVIRKVSNLGIITTYAGNGEAGFYGDGGQATDAQLNGPLFIAFDKYHDLYFSELYNNRIRKINHNTGVISTFAGNGGTTYSGDGIAATNAALYGPYGICFDQNNNLYIGDYANYRIRKVDTFGVISTIAGIGVPGFSGDDSLAIVAKINPVSGMCIDLFGNLYFATGGTRIRRINLATNIISTIAGNGILGFAGDGNQATNAEFSDVFDVKVDKYGNIFMTDFENNRIRYMDLSGIIHTIAGSGLAGYNGDNINSDSAELYAPRGVTLDSCENLYIADNGNARIRKVTFSSCNYLATPEKIKNNLEVTIYPNPCSETFYINNVETNTNYVLFNITCIIEQQGILKAGSNTLSIEALSPGLYILELTMDDGTRIMKKIIKL